MKTKKGKDPAPLHQGEWKEFVVFKKRSVENILGVFRYPSSSEFIRGKRRFFFLFFLAVAVLSLASCAKVAKEKPSGLSQETGPLGSIENPEVLGAFKTYNLVLSSGDCRYYSLKVSRGWYWKVFLTAENRDEIKTARFTAEIAGQGGGWIKLPETDLARKVELKHEGVQLLLGIGNSGYTNRALLRLCQEGVPVRVTIGSEVSSTAGLMGRRMKPKDE